MNTSSLLLTFTGVVLAPTAGAQADLYATDFLDDEGWTFSIGHSPTAWGSPSWGVDALPGGHSGLYRSPPHSLNFNHNVHGLQGGSWLGTARSPVIDLGVALAEPDLAFWYVLQGEGGCNVWVDVQVGIVDAATGATLFQDCFSNQGTWNAWVEIVVPLDRSWGEVQVDLRYTSFNAWNSGLPGLLIDDLRVTDPGGASVECEAQPLVGGGPGAELTLSGSASIAAGDLELRGVGFPAHTFAFAFAGSAPESIPIGAGVRCISPIGSRRLWIAPTRAAGTPRWSLDLGAGPIVDVATVGMPLYLQTIFRDGPTVNLSSTLVFTPVP